MKQNTALSLAVDSPPPTITIDPTITINPTITIDPEFAKRIVPLTDQERKELEANLKRDGCRDPLVVWNGVLLDGHHRYPICQKFKIKYSTTSMNFKTRAAAMEWIDANQLGRRNLTPHWMSVLRGRIYNRTKRQGARTDRTSAQTDQKSDRATALGKQLGVSRATIVRDGQHARAVDSLKPIVPDIDTQAVTGKVSKKAIREAARDPKRAAEILTKKTAAPPKPTPKTTIQQPIECAADGVGLMDHCRVIVRDLNVTLHALAVSRARAKWPADLNFEALIEELRKAIEVAETLKRAVPVEALGADSAVAIDPNDHAEAVS